MRDGDQTGGGRPPGRLEHLRPVEPVEPQASASATPVQHPILAWFAELRRRWVLAVLAALVVIGPVTTYAFVAVPTYTAIGALQVSTQGTAMNPLLELADVAGGSQVETEVEIIRRREFLLGVLERLRLHVVDPHQATWITTQSGVMFGRESPVSPRLEAVREAIDELEVGPDVFRRIAFSLQAVDDASLRVTVGAGQDAREHELRVGELLEDEALRLRLSAMPLSPGESMDLEALSDGQLLDDALADLRVTTIGTVRQPTNLVEVAFTHVDRDIARAVVEGIMAQYLEQSLRWQRQSASSASEFIAERLKEAEDRLRQGEDSLREFAEAEKAVQLDEQAKVAIQNAADLEAEGMQIELQERVIGSVLGGMKGRTAGGRASLTANFFDDPVVAAGVSALTEAETRHATLRATLTDDHPVVVQLAEEIRLRQGEVESLLRSARKNLTSRRAEIDRELESAMDALAEYPEKELQLARHVRDVEVGQRLYTFLLEKYQEAEIVEASTTTDKRVVDSATRPHKQTAPARMRLIGTGLLGGVLFSLASVYLAHLLRRRLSTIGAIKTAIPYPVYGSVPAFGERGKNGSGTSSRPDSVWTAPNSASAEAFRALAVNISHIAAVPDRARLVLVTSSKPHEGKSTVIANAAVALAKAGHRVLVIDLDLRKPTQHRVWGLRRAPGYSDIIAGAVDVSSGRGPIQTAEPFGLDLLTAGTRVPDTLGALMAGKLESWLVQWSRQYDFVLIDGPPAFVADTHVLLRHVDLLLVVARVGTIERTSARQMAESLSRASAAKGLVLNGVERRHADGYYGGYYYDGSYSAAADADDKRQVS